MNWKTGNHKIAETSWNRNQRRFGISLLPFENSHSMSYKLTFYTAASAAWILYHLILSSILDIVNTLVVLVGHVELRSDNVSRYERDELKLPVANNNGTLLRADHEFSWHCRLVLQAHRSKSSTRIKISSLLFQVVCSHLGTKWRS